MGKRVLLLSFLGGTLLAWLGAKESHRRHGVISHGDTVYVKGPGFDCHIDVDWFDVTPRARWCDQGDWQAFTVVKDIASDVEAGDVVYFQSHLGKYLWAREEGLRADQEGLAPQARFHIDKDGAGRVVPGDTISLKAHTGKYVGITDIDVHVSSDDKQKLIIEKGPSLLMRIEKRLWKCVAATKVFVTRTYEHFTHSPPLPDDLAGYKRRVQQTIDTFREMRNSQGNITLAHGAHDHVWGAVNFKSAKLDLRHYEHILGVDPQAMTVNVEGRAYYNDVLKYLLEKHQMTLEVIPDNVHLTLGGLYAGIGGGAASFKWGALHHSVLEVDVLTSKGEVVTCTPTQNADMFAALPGSLGTFGYVLRMVVRAIPAKRFVRSTHTRLNSSQAFEATMIEAMANMSLDFLDGAAYGPNDYLLIKGVMSDEKPDGAQIYSLQATGVPYAIEAHKGGELWFELFEYIYKWDPDGYFSTWDSPEWTRDPWLRGWLATLLPWFHRSDWLRELFGVIWEFDLKVEGTHMCGDYIVPLNGAASHLDWFAKEVDLYPLYLGPIGLNTKPLADYNLWQVVFPSIDFGIGYGPMGKYGSNKKRVIETRAKIEEHVGRVEGGTRLQYTNNNLGDTDAFWRHFPPGARNKYMAAKQRYDPDKVFPGIVEKLR